MANCYNAIMKNQNLIQAIKFTLFSASAGIIQIGVCTLMDEVCHITYWVSYLTSLVLSVIWNFTFNRKFTFKSASNVPLAMVLALLFYVPFTPCSTLWGAAMEKAGVPGIVVTAFSMIVNFVLEFLWQKFVVFRDSLNSTEDKSFNIIMKSINSKL